MGHQSCSTCEISFLSEYVLNISAAQCSKSFKVVLKCKYSHLGAYEVGYMVVLSGGVVKEAQTTLRLGAQVGRKGCPKLKKR